MAHELARRRVRGLAAGASHDERKARSIASTNTRSTHVAKAGSARSAGRSRLGKDNTDCRIGTLSKLSDGREQATRFVDALIQSWDENSDIAQSFAELMLLCCQLYSLADQPETARTLAVRTLARAELVASAEQRAALKRFASGR